MSRISSMSIDATLAKIHADSLKKLQRETYQRAQKAHKYAYQLYYSIMCSKHYQPTYNYTTCMWSILYSFPNIVTNSNARLIVSSVKRLEGVMKKRSINPQKLQMIEKISKDFFCEIMPYTGANLIMTGLKDKQIVAEEMYDLLNDTTPVIFSIQVSHSTVIYCLMDEVKAKELAEKYNNCTLTMEDGDPKKVESFVSSKIQTIYVKTLLNTRSQSYEWGSKKTSVDCVIETMNFRVPLHQVIEHSAKMKERFDQ